MVDFPLFVDDLSRQSDHDLRQRAVSDAMKLFPLVLRHARSPDFLEHAARWLDLWHGVTTAETGILALVDILRYIGHVSPNVDQERLQALLPTDVEEVRDIMPTIFEQGLIEGRLEGRQQQLLILLRQRFGALSPEVEQRVRGADAATLDRWALRVLTAVTIEEVLAQHQRE